MKKIILSLFAVVSAAVMFVSCSKSDPKGVAKEWLTDFYHQDYDAAKKLSTEETKNMIATIQGFTSAFPDSVKQKAKQTTITIINDSTKIEGDKATVKFIASDNPSKQEELHLKKENEKWLVQFSKNDMMSGDTKTGDAPAATMTPDNSAAPAGTPDANMAPDTSAKH